MISLLLLLKSVYCFTLIYFEFPLLQAAPLKFLTASALFNYTFTFLLSRRNHSLNLVKSVIAATGISWFLVVVTGAGPFNWNTLVFSVFLASSAFNFVTIPVLYQKNQNIIQQYQKIWKFFNTVTLDYLNWNCCLWPSRLLLSLFFAHFWDLWLALYSPAW